MLSTLYLVLAVVHFGVAIYSILYREGNIYTGDTGIHFAMCIAWSALYVAMENKEKIEKMKREDK